MLFWTMDTAGGVPGGGFSSGFQLPGGVRVMRTGIFDSTGVARLRIQVPPGAALGGSTVSAQASITSGIDLAVAGAPVLMGPMVLMLVVDMVMEGEWMKKDGRWLSYSTPL